MTVADYEGFVTGLTGEKTMSSYERSGVSVPDNHNYIRMPNTNTEERMALERIARERMARVHKDYINAFGTADKYFIEQIEKIKADETMKEDQKRALIKVLENSRDLLFKETRYVANTSW